MRSKIVKKLKILKQKTQLQNISNLSSENKSKIENYIIIATNKTLVVFKKEYENSYSL